jgi:hypothetical protein
MKKFIFGILTASTLAVSCNTDLDINKNPDNLDPSSASLAAQLPAGIIGLAGSEGAGMAIFGGFWSQYWTQSNTANQFKDIDNYSAGTADYNFIWNGMYDALGDIRNIKRRAEAQGNWNYYLIATVLQVQGSQLLTDFYGSIPYTEAGDPSNLTPHFNTGEEVYDLMIVDLDNALSKDLSTSVGELPDNHDMVFQGDMDKWTAFANTLKLKIYMRQTNSSRAAIANAGITALLGSGVTFLNEDAGIDVFKDEANQSNPLSEYIERQLNVATNLRASNTLFSYLVGNGDPRKPFYYEAGNALPQGDFLSSASNIAVVNLHYETPVYFMTREESLFLQAEAALRYNGGSGAKALYDAAVNENFSKYGLSGGALLAGAYAYPTAGTFDEQLEAIITQKWIAAFPGNGFEAFFDQNRTGYPTTFTYSVNGSTAGLFPKRIEYPLSERNSNPNAPALVPITTPVWWDN